ncbi:MAG TPA: porin [bacterium]|nr:porin [bacterium]
MKKFKVSGYVQARYEYHDDAISNPALGTASTDSRNMGKLLNRFYIRRGRLKVTFQANKNASGVVYFDGSASGVSLKEAFVALTEPRSEVRFTLGQFNWPFGYEVSFSSSKREFPERARWSRTLFPGERDRGVKVERAFKIEDRYDLNLTAGVFNGNGIEDRVFGATDPNKSKDFIARAACDFGALDVGVSGYWGEQFNPSDSAVPVQTPSSTDKIRYGADAQFAFDVPRLGGGALKAEFVVGQEPKNQSKAFLSSDTTRDVTGLDVVLAQNLHPNLQFISRIDYYDPDRDIKSDEFVAYGLGLVYFWDNHSKVKLVYEIPKSGKNARSGLEPGTTKDLKDNILTMEWVYTF